MASSLAPCLPASPCPLTDPPALTHQGPGPAPPHHVAQQMQVSWDVNPRLPNGLVVALLMVVGILGNSLVLYVYHCKMQRTVFTTFVTVLAGLDLATAVLGMPVDVVIKSLMLGRTTAMDTVCKLVHFEVYTSSLASGGILLLIAITRYNKVCHAMQPSLTISKARRLCVIVVLVAMVLCTITLVINGMEPIMITVGQRQAVHGNHTNDTLTVPSNMVHGHMASSHNASLTQASNRFQANLNTRNASLTEASNVFPGSPTTNGTNTLSQPSNSLQPATDTLAHQDISRQVLKQGEAPNPTPLARETAGPTITYTADEVVEVNICRTSQQQKGTGLYYVLQVLLVLAYLAILVSLVVLHCCISRTLLSFQRRRRSTCSQTSLQPATSPTGLHHMNTMFRIFAVITATFVLSYLPHLVCMAVERSLYGDGRATSRLVRIIMDLAYNFPYINVVANPFIYSYMSRGFREQCLRLCCCSSVRKYEDSKK